MSALDLGTAGAAPASPPPDAALGRRLRVLVVVGHEVVQWGMRTVLGRMAWVSRCVPALDAAQAELRAMRYEPHLALVGAMVGGESGIAICRRIRRVSPGTRVLLVSDATSSFSGAARAAGASGVVADDATATELVQAVLDVANGGQRFQARARRRGEGLSGREVDVLRLIATGATNEQIAATLRLSPHTVKDHASALYRKLGVPNRAAAVERGRHLGVVA
jgi:DNA-binding NarL/FixJ family response regulator